MASPPTVDAYMPLAHAHEFFNGRLFNNELRAVLVTYHNASKSHGYYLRERWINDKNKRIGEISMNSALFGVFSPEQGMAAFVHIMVHQWQDERDKSARKGYHNREFADKMIAIGLYPSPTGLPSDLPTVGESMSQYIITDGPFARAAADFMRTQHWLVWFDRTLARETDINLAPPCSYPMPTPKAKTRPAKADAPPSAPPAAEPAPPPGQQPPDGTQAVDPHAGIEPGSAPGSDPAGSPSPAANANDDADHDQAPADAGQHADDDSDALADEFLTSVSGVPLSPRPIETHLDFQQPKAVNKTNRVKWSCTVCRDSVWGKDSVKIICGKCHVPWVVAPEKKKAGPVFAGLQQPAKPEEPLPPDTSGSPPVHPDSPGPDVGDLPPGDLPPGDGHMPPGDGGTTGFSQEERPPGDSHPDDMMPPAA